MAGRGFQVARAWAKRVGAGVAVSLLLFGVATAATTYSYDGQGRVVQVAYDNGVTVIYAYDLAGNRTTVTISAPSSTLWGSFNWGAANWQ